MSCALAWGCGTTSPARSSAPFGLAFLGVMTNSQLLRLFWGSLRALSSLLLMRGGGEVLQTDISFFAVKPFKPSNPSASTLQPCWKAFALGKPSCKLLYEGRPLEFDLATGQEAREVWSGGVPSCLDDSGPT